MSWAHTLQVGLITALAFAAIGSLALIAAALVAAAIAVFEWGMKHWPERPPVETTDDASDEQERYW